MIYFIGWVVITAALFAFYILSGAVERDNEMEGMLVIVLWPFFLAALPIALVMFAPIAIGGGIALAVQWVKDRRQGVSHE